MMPLLDGERLTPMGLRLVGMIDRHIAAKAGMTDELRHYAAAVYRARLMKPAQWIAAYPEKAEALWVYFHEADEEADSELPPTMNQRRTHHRGAENTERTWRDTVGED
ncbi:MAG: hypothetical protein JNJ61_20445 [Anaerolineae bacterium]|nr:hypothetical protein [Anaerolineae bacterium]